MQIKIRKKSKLKGASVASGTVLTVGKELDAQTADRLIRMGNAARHIEKVEEDVKDS